MTPLGFISFLISHTQTHILFSNSCGRPASQLNSHMEALLSGDGPAHSTAWRGPGRGEVGGRLTDSLSGSDIDKFSLDPCLQTWPTVMQTWQWGGREEKKKPWKEYRVQALKNSCLQEPPTSAESGSQILVLPCKTHLSDCSARCPPADSEVHILYVSPLQNLYTLQHIFCAAKSSAALLCCGSRRLALSFNWE